MRKRGFEQYCDELEKVENYEKALAGNFIGWDCHHRLETHNSDGERRAVDLLSEELKALDMYYHRPAEELVFLNKSVHRSLHNKGKTLSEEHKKKIAETLEGHTVSEETREKLRAHKGWHHTEETRKKMSESRKGVKRGPLSKEHKMKIAEANRNRSEETRKKLSEAVKGKKWFNNGEISVMSFECPKGFVPGRISWKKKGDR